MAAAVLAPLAGVPDVETDTSCVEGVQPPEAPAQVSRTKISATSLVSPATRFVAEEMKVTNRPSALIDGETLAAFAGLLLTPAETSVTEGAQPEVAPSHVSCTKTFSGVPATSFCPSVDASTATV